MVGQLIALERHVGQSALMIGTADMANYELLVPNFSLNSTMDRQLNYNYNFLNFQNYQL